MEILIACFGLISAIHFTVVTKNKKNDSYALELYIEDKKYHRDNCYHIDWDQPKIEVYRKTLRSHMPKDCSN